MRTPLPGFDLSQEAQRFLSQVDAADRADLVGQYEIHRSKGIPELQSVDERVAADICLCRKRRCYMTRLPTVRTV